MPTADLVALTAKIQRALSTRPECFVTHPTELHVLHTAKEDELAEIARNHGWRMVSRVGGRQIEFYNDAGVANRAL